VQPIAQRPDILRFAFPYHEHVGPRSLKCSNPLGITPDAHTTSAMLRASFSVSGPPVFEIFMAITFDGAEVRGRAQSRKERNRLPGQLMTALVH
jgi:hypothetical protein